MKKWFVLILMLCTGVAAWSQKTDHRLEKQIRELLQGFQGEVGVYVKNLRTGRVAVYQPDTVFPTASIVKVPILVGVMDKIERGGLDYSGTQTYRDSLLYAGEDILGSFKDGEKIALKKVIMLMLTTSDNTASLWLQKLAGTGTRINEIMDSLGLANTRVNSRTPGRESNRSVYGWGQTTPREMAQLFELIYQYKVISPAASEQMLRCLGRNFWDAEALSEIPPTIEVFSKNGAVNASRSEVLLVNAPRNPYLFCVFTKNNRDQSWGDSNEAWKMTRKLSALCWKYFNRRNNWEPARKKSD